jgi:hypothetical protein
MSGTNPPALPSIRYYALSAIRELDPDSMDAFSWLVVTALIFTSFISAFGNWTYFIGGRFTPLQTWTGFGKLRSSAGTDYGLYLHLSQHKADKVVPVLGAKPNLRGAATLCTPQGAKYELEIEGLVRDAWWITEGRDTGLALMSGTGSAAQRFHLRGQWRNGNLVMDDKGSMAAWLKRNDLPPRRSKHHPQRKGNRAEVTVVYGERSQFDDLCSNLIASPYRQ